MNCCSFALFFSTRPLVALPWLLLACSPSTEPAPSGNDPSDCEPTSCQALAANCGVQPDGCNGTLDCGQCADGMTCGASAPNQCGTGTCSPLTCDSIAGCGALSDGCGQLLNCPCIDGTGGQLNSGTGGASGGSDAGTGGASPNGGTGGGTTNPGDWNAFIPSGAANNLASEYATWRSRHYHECNDGTGRASVLAGTNRVVSEGIGYGMLITATLGTQADFDGLVQFYQDAAKGTSGLMNWECAACGSCGGGGPATDADLDVAMALVQANARWGGYSTLAVQVIENLRKPAVTEVCGAFTIMRPGDHWGGCSDGGSSLINPSYWAPGYYRVFAQVDTAGAATWNKLIDDSYTLFEMSENGHPDNLFLWPDAMNWNGSTFVNATGFSYNGYDACRVPWRLAMDYAWSGDARAGALLTWASGQVDSRGYAGITNQTNSAFYGALALGSTAVSQDKANEHFDNWMAASLDDEPYYQGTLRLLYLMTAAGQFPSTL